MDKPYSNREIDEFFNRQNEHFKMINRKLDMMLEQVKTTNNRVTKLEKWRFGINMVLSFIGVIIIPLVIVAIQSIL